MSEITISAVIPTMDRATVLRRCVARLAPQLAAAGGELIVVSDSRDGAPERTAAALADAGGARHLVADEPGASAARNLGWRSANSELILFLGDDILADPGLVADHLRFHSGGDLLHGLLGSVRWADEMEVTRFMRWLERGIQFDYANLERGEVGWGRFYTANVSLHRSTLERVGGFDTENLPFLYEDLDLAYRMAEHGFRLFYEASAPAQHLHPTTPTSWSGRLETLARAERTFVAKHPGIPPYFHRLFSNAAAAKSARGRLARLAGPVPDRIPVLGDLIRRSESMQFARALAPRFLEAWAEDERLRPEAYPASSGGGSPGPK